MIEPDAKKEEILLTEEEPVPEEYKDHRLTNENNNSQNTKKQLEFLDIQIQELNDQLKVSRGAICQN